MRAVLQRVSAAKVELNASICGEISFGLLILLGVEESDEENDVDWLAQKIAQMRIFSDKKDKMNMSLIDVGGQALVVSQFTLYASTKKGNRPSFINAARPEKANQLYESFKLKMEQLLNKKTECGIFGADMKVSLLNDGPVTIIIDSKNRE